MKRNKKDTEILELIRELKSKQHNNTTPLVNVDGDHITIGDPETLSPNFKTSGK